MFQQALRSASALSILIAMAAAAPVASAQSSETVDEHEVIVTARKRTENLQQVPLSINAIGKAYIEEANIVTMDDVAALTPGLTFDTGIMPNDTRPSLRGIAGDRGRPGVAILVDGIDVSSESLVSPGGGVLGNMRLLDLERIEVVKGPQSVLYGRSAFAGAINYITARPASEFGGSAQVIFDEHNSIDLRGMIEGPIIADKLNGKVSLFSYNTDGWYENQNTGGDLGAIDSYGGSVALEYKPTDAFSAYARVEYTDDDYSPLPKGFISSRFTNQFLPIPAADGSVTNCTSVFGGFYDQFRFFSPFPLPPGENCIPAVLGEVDIDNVMLDLSPDPRTGDDFEGSTLKNLRGSLHMTYDLNDKVRLESLTGYTDAESEMDEDFDQTNYSLPTTGSLALDPILGPFAPFAPPEFSLSSNSSTDNNIEQFSQEFRVHIEDERATLLLDLLYWYEEMEAITKSQFWLRDGSDVAGLNAFFTSMNFFGPGVPVNLLASPFPEDQYPGYPVTRETNHISFAAAFSYKLTDDLNVGLEARVLDETLDYTGQTTGIAGNDPLALSLFQLPSFLLFPTENSVSSNAFLPRFTVDWQASDDVLVYAQIAKGFKPAGVGTTDANGDVTDQPFFAEKLWSYEAGLKTNGLLGSGSMLNLAAYYNDYTDRQVGYRFRDQGFIQSGIVNAAKVEVYGVEADWMIRPTENLTFGGGYAYTDGEFVDFNLLQASQRVAAELGLTGAVPEVSPNNRAHSGNFEGDFSGNTVTFTSKHSLSLYGRYEQEVMDGKTFFTAIDGRYNSKRFIDNGNDTWLPSHWVADARIGLRSDDWKAFIFVDNILDDDKPKSGTTNAEYGFLPDGQTPQDGILINMPQPRTIGVQVGYDF